MNKFVKLVSIAIVHILSLSSLKGFAFCTDERSPFFGDISNGLDKSAFNNPDLLYTLKRFQKSLPHPRRETSRPRAIVPLIIHPYLGAYMSDGRLVLPSPIQLKELINFLYNEPFSFTSFYTKEFSLYMDVESSASNPKKVLYHFNSFWRKYWKLWLKKHALPTNLRHQLIQTGSSSTFFRILDSDGLINIKNCQNREVFKPTSIGYALLSVIAHYVQQLGLDPNSLSIKELMAIGLGYEQQKTLVTQYTQQALSSFAVQQRQPRFDHQRIDQSLLVQAALLYSHKRGLLDLNQVLTTDQVNASIKQFKRHYQASTLHMRALDLFQQAKKVKSIPTIESVARKELLKVGLNPDKRVGIKIGLLPVCKDHQHLSSCTDSIWKFYARIHNWTGKHNALIHPDFNYGDFDRTGQSSQLYQKLPDLKTAFKLSIRKLSTSSEYSKYKRAVALLYKADLYLRDDLPEESLALISNDRNAHNIKMAYYGLSDQALMYFDPTKGEKGLYSLVVLQDKIRVYNFSNLNQFKHWLSEYKNQSYFRTLFSQIPESIWMDSLPKYFDAFVSGDDWIWRWNSAFWEKAIDFIPVNGLHPFESILTRELNSYLEKSLANIVTTQELWIEGIHQLLTFIPFIGQPIDMIWNLAEGNAQGALIDLAFIATEFPEDIGLSMALLKRASVVFKLKEEAFSSDIMLSESQFDFHGTQTSARKLESSLGMIDVSKNELIRPTYTATLAENNTSMEFASHPALLDEGYHVAYDAKGRRQHYLFYQDEIIHVEPDQNDLRQFYPKLKQNAHNVYRVEPQTDIAHKENRFKQAFHLGPSDQTIAWQHPVTGEVLQVVKIHKSGQITAVKRESSGVLRPVDFDTGEPLPNHDVVFKKTYPNRTQFGYKPLQGEGLPDIATRRAAKRGVIDILLDVIKIGNRGELELTEVQRQDIRKLLSKLFVVQANHAMATSNSTLTTTRINKTMIESILKTAKGFNKRPAKGLFAQFDNINTMHDYLLALYKNINHCQLGHIHDIGLWVKQFVEEQKGVLKYQSTFSASTAERMIQRINQFERYKRKHTPPARGSEFPQKLLILPDRGSAEVLYQAGYVSKEINTITIPLNNHRTLTEQLLDYFEPLDDGIYGSLDIPEAFDPEGNIKKNLFDIIQISINDDNSKSINRLFFPRRKLGKFSSYKTMFDTLPIDAPHIEHLVTPLNYNQVLSEKYSLKFAEYNGLHVIQQGTTSSCGPTALAMVLSDYGIKADWSAVIEEAQTGTFINQLYAYSKEDAPTLGTYMEIISEDIIASLQHRLSPSGRAKAAIVNYGGHFIVIDRFEEGKVFIRDPYMGTLSKLPVNELSTNAFGKKVLFFPKQYQRPMMNSL